MRAINLITLSLAVALSACASKAPAPGDDVQSTAQASSTDASSVDRASAAGNNVGGDNANARSRMTAPSEHSVYFGFDSYAVPIGASTLLQEHARYISGNPAPVRVEGNADERGSREYNLALGQRRAESVRQALVLDGAKGDTIEAISYGKEKPRCTEETEQCFAANRRADIVTGR
jgi:peptidoglycan-associated lipoprotein